MGRKLTKESFVKACIDKHEGFYSYEEIIFTNVRANILITCPIHGKFEQCAANHLYKKQGCPKCAWEKELKNRQKYKNTKEDFFKLLPKTHIEKYDYSKLKTFQYKEKGIFICPIHGEFKQSIKNHIASKGCYKCGRESFIEKQSTLGSILKQKLNISLNTVTINIEPNKLYTYKSILNCNCKIHGDFKKRLSLLYKGVSCVKCRYKGYSRKDFLDYCKNRNKKTAIFYAIKIYNKTESFLKLGITSNTVKKRYRKLLFKTGYSYKILFEVSDTPRKIWDLEYKLKKSFTTFSYTPKVYFSGYSESFFESIFSNIILKLKNEGYEL